MGSKNITVTAGIEYKYDQNRTTNTLRIGLVNKRTAVINQMVSAGEIGAHKQKQVKC